MSAPSDPATITAGVLLGSKLVAEDLGALKKAKVTHVLNTASEIPNYHEGNAEAGVVYLQLSLNDDEDDDITAEFEKCSAWIADAVAGGGIVFVHCQAGISRSASIVMAYLMAKESMSLKEAFLHTKAKRHNIGFGTLFGLHPPEFVCFCP
jgi:protein-tyrosine phosphatase